MKYLLVFILIGNVKAFDNKNFIKGCLSGSKLGQVFLQSEHLKTDLQKIQKDCSLDKNFQNGLKSLSGQESFLYGCGAGVSLSLAYYKQSGILNSPRTQQIIEKCQKL